MSVAHDAFSADYAEARAKFIAAAGDAGLLVESKTHPQPGLNGEELAMDVARDGHPSASRLLVVSSACHGVEGFCGSGVQVAALRDPAFRAHAADQGVAVLYIHALNPFGFSHLRRTTHENVDLNRNFHDFGAPLPVNVGYRELHPLLVPEDWPPTADNMAAIQQYIATRGERAYQSAISGGQHEFSDGLFFGGRAPTWSNLTLREVLRVHGRRAGRLGWIDVHTGLGPSGHGERIFAGRNDPAELERARAWWDGGGKTPVTSFYDGSSSSAVLTGLMFTSVYEECPQAEYTGMALEYGTVPVLKVMQALRGEQWLNAHPDAPAAKAAEIRQAVRDAFFTDTAEWREQILAQAREALMQAVDGLAA
ncbi:MAG: DUF2817 domain-containing protein [Comamonadaceae bacterium]|nr:MAG: DUF2817 domain-containing protein [Comamonadaceae bacterium]